MMPIEHIFTMAKKVEEVGEPITQKSDADVYSMDMKKLSEIYTKDPITHNAINKSTQLMLSAPHKINKMSSDFQMFLKVIGEVGTPITWEEIEETILKHGAIYGSSWTELVFDKTDKRIVDIMPINPESMDYARDSKGVVVVDRYSNPVGYIHSLPIGVVPIQRDTRLMSKNVVLKSNELFMLPKRIAKIDLFTAGDGLKSYGYIETAYASIRRRMELEAGYATALDKSFPVRVGKYGDAMNRPTPQKLQDFLKLLVNLRGINDSVAIPYHSSIEMLESKSVQSVLEPIKYYMTIGLSSFGIPTPFVVGLGEDTNRATLGTQADIYAKSLDFLIIKYYKQIERKIFKPICETNGISTVPEYEWENVSFAPVSDIPQGPQAKPKAKKNEEPKSE